MSILFVNCLLLFNSVQAQDLIESRHTSFLTYIYELTNKEAKHIYHQKRWDIDTSFFHTLIDTYPTDSSLAHGGNLDAGHYLKVYIEESQLQLAITSIQNFHVDVLNNSTDLQIKVYENSGETIDNAKVKLRGKRIRFDKKTGNYRLKKANRNGLLEVKHGNEVAYYDLDKRYKNALAKRVFRKTVYGSPLRHVWKPVRFVIGIPIDGVKSLVRQYPTGVIGSIWNASKRSFYTVACWFDDYFCDWYGNSYKFERKHQGYFVFSQPKYLPGDTVKFKAFITKKGRPLKKPLQLVLEKSYNDKVLLTSLTPYTSGGYAYQFPLGDTLDLTLDKRYAVVLQKKDGRKYISDYFKYEEYELSKNQLKLETMNATHFLGDTAIINVTGKDENDLNLLDARLEILVRPEEVLQTFQKNVFVPDTIAFFKKELLANKKTEIRLHSAMFPKGNLNYKVEVTLLTSDNERITENEYLQYNYQRNEIEIELRQDSIDVSFLQNGKSIEKESLIYAIDGFGHHIDTLQLSVPSSFQLNPYAAQYLVKIDHLEKRHSLREEPSLLSFSTRRTTDSLIIHTINPRKIIFNYYLYKTNNEIDRGYTKNLNVKKRTGYEKNYYVAVQYLWGGKVREENYEIGLRKDLLNLKLINPAVAYPGQKIKVELEVTDLNGNPAKNTDVLVHGLTKKFHFEPPKLPVLAKAKKQRTLINSFEIDQSPFFQQQKTVDYDKWNPLARLDTIAFFQFLYPGNAIYKYETYLEDSTTQFAPFVVADGVIQPVSVVSVDNRPVYFGWSVNEPYSFSVESGYHSIGIRTDKYQFTIDSVYITEGKKHIFSFDQNKLPETILSSERTFEFTLAERRQLYRYIFPYKNTFDDHLGYFKQDERYFLAPPSSSKSLLSGPVGPSVVNFLVFDSYDLSFFHEPFFEYEPSPALLKMRSFDPIVKYPKRAISKAKAGLTDEAWSKKSIEHLWKEELLRRRIASRRYFNPKATEKGQGALQLKMPTSKHIGAVLNTLLFKLDDAEFLRVYPELNNHFHQLDSGSYKAIFFAEENRYIILDSILVDINGLSLFTPDSLTFHPKDSFSLEINRLMDNYFNYHRQSHPLFDDEKQHIRRAYQRQFQYFGEGNIVSGYVFSEEDGQPIPGVNVVVKGTTYGTITDLEGYYSVKVPTGYSGLVFSFIGMESQEKSTLSSDQLDIQMTADVQQLSEVIVTGYGVESKRSLTSSVSTVLQGQVAGVSIQGLPGATPSMVIRGASSLSASSQPLIVVDGVPYFGELNDLDQNLFQGMEMLKGESATAIYGAQAVNGVLLITTKDGVVGNNRPNAKGAEISNGFLEGVSQQNSIRNNFSDVAFWQPQLRTNEDGKVSFEVTIPDDITKWETFAYAMNGNKQVGQTRAEIKSFKPLVAQLNTPRFLLTNDSATIIGKSLNYTFDTVAIQTVFEMGNEVFQTKNIKLVNAAIDMITVVPGLENDSIKLKYYLKRDDGYFDGEQREIPVYPVGIEKKEGYFVSFFSDTTVTWTFPKADGPVKIYATGSAADIVKKKMVELIDYTYNCNEQMASKLLAHLVASELEAKTASDRKIKRLIKRLVANQNKQGLWGWWGTGNSEMWISLHVAEALKLASEAGFKTPINKSILEEEAIWNLQIEKPTSKHIDWLYLSSLLDLKIDQLTFATQVDSIEKYDMASRLKYEVIKGLNKMPVNFQWVLDSLKETQMGGLYLPSEKRATRGTRPTWTNTMFALKVFAFDSTVSNQTIRKLQNYLLENLTTQRYINTYLTSSMISAISKGLQKQQQDLNPVLMISGDHEERVESFPYEKNLDNINTLTLSKEGELPVFLNAYQTKWEKNVTMDTSSFMISTQFENNNNTLEAGSPVKLKVNVEVFKDAEFVMIEVPIPAGCSYNSKPSSFPNEVHRAYFKEKVAIFCTQLNKGAYQFEVDLLPRYSGAYTLNPAKIEWMYFPVFHANEGVKRVRISE